MKYLTESAFVMHEAAELSDTLIRAVWGDDTAQFVWMQKGRITIGGIEDLLAFRREAGGPVRLATHVDLERYEKIGADAVLGASGVMSVCVRGGYDAAVSAGISGFFSEKLLEGGALLVSRGSGPPDIAALLEYKTTLLASGFKDVFDYGTTFTFLHQHGVRVLGAKREAYTGYLFTGEPAALTSDGIQVPEGVKRSESTLIINDTDESKRLSKRDLYDQADQFALQEEHAGGYYLEAFDRKLSELTGHYTALLQLAALLANVKLAKNL